VPGVYTPIAFYPLSPYQLPYGPLFYIDLLTVAFYFIPFTLNYFENYKKTIYNLSLKISWSTLVKKNTTVINH
jgi:hypothetical protein